MVRPHFTRPCTVHYFLLIGHAILGENCKIPPVKNDNLCVEVNCTCLLLKTNVYLTILHALNVSNESETAGIHTGFHRFTEIGQIVHNKYIFNTKNFVQIEIWKMVWTFFFYNNF